MIGIRRDFGLSYVDLISVLEIKNFHHVQERPSRDEMLRNEQIKHPLNICRKQEKTSETNQMEERCELTSKRKHVHGNGLDIVRNN